MGWLIIVLIIVIGIIIKFFLDRDSMLQKQVDSKGGMKLKYKYLIDHFSQDGNPEFVEVKRDYLHFRFVGSPSIINYYITEHFNAVVIEWIAQLGLAGTHTLKWQFSNTDSIEKMAERMTIDMNDLHTKKFGNFPF